MILRRIEGSRYSEVLPLWRGHTVVIIGGGESLTRDQIELARAAHAADRCRCIAINDAYLWAPWADVGYAADPHWHGWHTHGVAKPLLGLTADEVRERWESFLGQKCSIESGGSAAIDDDVHLLRNRDYPVLGFGLSEDPRALVTGRNSGFQALNLATLAGASPILLLAFDGKPGAAKSHWHGGHPQPTPPAAYEQYRRAMSAAENALLRLGIEVINVTPGSAIDSFRKSSLEAEFELERV